VSGKKANPQEPLSRNFSTDDLEVLKIRRDFVEAMTTVKTLGVAEGSLDFSSQLSQQRLRLQDLDYATVLMFAIHQLTINVVLADYSIAHFNFETEEELARELEKWTHGDRVKLHIPGTHTESAAENAPKDTLERPSGDD
jgi:hypothetical protein